MQFQAFCWLLLTAHGLLQKPNAPSKTHVSGLQAEADLTTGPVLANARSLGKQHPSHPRATCSCDSSRYRGVVLHSHAPAAGHHTGRAVGEGQGRCSQTWHGDFLSQLESEAKQTSYPWCMRLAMSQPTWEILPRVAQPGQ